MSARLKISQKVIDEYLRAEIDQPSLLITQHSALSTFYLPPGEMVVELTPLTTNTIHQNFNIKVSFVCELLTVEDGSIPILQIQDFRSTSFPLASGKLALL